MALIPELRVPITGDHRQLSAALAQARAELKRFEAQAAQDTARIQASVGRFTGVQAAAFRLLGAGLATKQVTDYADAWTTAQNKMNAASQIAGRQARSLSALNDIANETRTGLTETADLYAKLLRSTAQVAESEEEVARATEIVNKAFKAGGAATSEQVAGILQLSQALGSGVLQGDELRSLRENAPLVAAAIAEEFDTTVAGLKKLGAEGKLTSDRIFDAILAAAPKVEAAFAVTQGTIGDSWTVLQNQITEAVGSLDQAFEGSQAVKEEFVRLGQAIEFVVGWLLDMQQPIENIDAIWRRWTGTINDFAGALGRIPFSKVAAGVVGAENLQQLLGTEPSAADLAIRGGFRAAESGATDIALRRALQSRARASNAGSAPAFGTGSGGAAGGGGGRTPGEKFGDDLADIQARTNALQLEAAMVGRSVYEHERAEAILRLEQEARRAGITDIEAYREQINAEADAYAQSVVALKERERAFQAAQEAQAFLAEGLADIAMAENLDDAAQAANRLVAALRNAVLQAILLGKGPLAGIFGTASAQGGTGGIFGALFGIGRAAPALSPAAASLTGAGLFHSGGLVGGPGPSRLVPALAFAGAPRFHTGRMPWGPRERPAILEDGEMVVPAAIARAVRGGERYGNGGSGDVKVHISQHGQVQTGVTGARRRPDGGVDIELFARELVKSVGEEYGLSPRLRHR